MVFESLEVSSRILSEDVSNLVLISRWAPEVSNVGSLTLSHIVKSMIKGLFLSYKPFVDLQ
jgi:hypothetical protein